MFARLWRQRRLIVLNCVAAYLACILNPSLLVPFAAVLPEGAATPVNFTAAVLVLSLVVCHLAPRWRWIPFSLIVGYAVADYAARTLMPHFTEVLPKGLFILDERRLPSQPGPVIIIVLTIVATLLLRMIGGLIDMIPTRRLHETVVGGVIRRPRKELWEVMKPEVDERHWHPEVQAVERDRMNPKLTHVVLWRKFGNDQARRLRFIEDLVPGQQFREVIADDPRSTETRGMSGSTGWLLEDHKKGTFLTMREEVTGLGRMTPLWRWFDDYERDFFVFLRAHLEGGRDWSLYGLNIVRGDE